MTDKLNIHLEMDAEFKTPEDLERFVRRLGLMFGNDWAEKLLEENHANVDLKEMPSGRRTVVLAGRIEEGGKDGL